MKALPDQPTALHQLAEKIDREGPITLGEYMAIANADYYARKDPIGEDGDFVTAPEISQMFGELIGIWLADLWHRKNRPSDCHYVELGPGRGTLASDALRAMSKFDWEPHVHFVESSPVLRNKQAELHANAIWHETVDRLPEDGPLLVIANEFFDALPVEQIVFTETGWRHQMVTRERNKFVAIPDEKPAEAHLTTKMEFEIGTILESSPASIKIMGTLADRIAKQGGALLIIDYGYDKPGTGSTLQAVKAHMPISPFDSPGTSDLTAHVNFLDLANAARNRMLNIHGPTEQGIWLKAIGIDQRTTSLCNASPKQADEIRASHHRLTHLDEMGRLFRVMAATALDWPSPEGFVYGEDGELA